MNFFNLTISELLQIVALYGLCCLILSIAILGLFLAGNHKFVENGEEKGLVLVSFKEWLDSLFISMDRSKLLKAIKNWIVFLPPLAGVGYGVVKFLQTGDINYLALIASVASLSLFRKSFEDIGVMVLGCYRCMSTFWVAIPMSTAGVIAGLMVSTVYFWLVPFSMFTTAVISATVSYIYMNYDECKLNVAELKREREIFKTQLELCEQEKKTSINKTKLVEA